VGLVMLHVVQLRFEFRRHTQGVGQFFFQVAHFGCIRQSGSN
jgi:hypothetical protein